MLTCLLTYLLTKVLTGGSFPIVDGVVTAIDAIEGVTLAKVVGLSST